MRSHLGFFCGETGWKGVAELRTKKEQKVAKVVRRRINVEGVVKGECRAVTRTASSRGNSANPKRR
jgi:hypothetical protein